MKRLFPCPFLFFLLACTASGLMEMTNLFTADCEGGVHMMAGTALEFNVNAATPKMLLDYGYAVMLEEAKRACPEITTDEFELYVVPSLPMLLKQAQDNDQGHSFKNKCPNLKVIERVVDYDDTSNDILPPSCTYERYRDGHGCGIGFALTSLDVEIEATVAKCPSSSMPFVKIQCRGEGCVDAGKPCNSDDECGGSGNSQMKCFRMMSDDTMDASKMYTKVAEVATLMGPNPPSYSSSFCSSIYGDKGMLGMVTDAKTWLRKSFYFDSSPSTDGGSKMSMCMWGGNSNGVRSNSISTNSNAPDDIYFDHLEKLFDSISDDIDKERPLYGGNFFRPFFPLMSSLTTPILNGRGFFTPPFATETADSIATMFYTNSIDQWGFSLFNSRLGLAMHQPGMLDFVAKLVSYFENGQQCRAAAYNLAALTPQQFRNSWLFYHADRILKQLSTDGQGHDGDLAPPDLHGFLDKLFTVNAAGWRRRLAAVAAGPMEKAQSWQHWLARHAMPKRSHQRRLNHDCLSTGCPYTRWIGDGACDDLCFNDECAWDGGDCKDVYYHNNYKHYNQPQ